MEIRNKSAYFEYHIDDKYDAGLVLTGTEVKALREGRASFNDSYCFFNRGELWIKSLYIGEYSHGAYANHAPLRERKLLLTKRELNRLFAKIKEKGYTLIPLKIYFNEKGFAKIQIGLGKGKKIHDKRETIRERDNERALRRYSR